LCRSEAGEALAADALAAAAEEDVVGRGWRVVGIGEGLLDGEEVVEGESWESGE
jgi:hypothetical protein